LVESFGCCKLCELRFTKSEELLTGRHIVIEYRLGEEKDLREEERKERSLCEFFKEKTEWMLSEMALKNVPRHNLLLTVAECQVPETSISQAKIWGRQCVHITRITSRKVITEVFTCA